MSQLPARPDLDQLRRQARELYRAALGGDARALRRLRQVSGTVALSQALLVGGGGGNGSATRTSSPPRLTI